MTYKLDLDAMAKRLRAVAPTMRDPRDAELFIQYAEEYEQRAREVRSGQA
jgi:hypothetical protein